MELGHRDCPLPQIGSHNNVATGRHDTRTSVIVWREASAGSLVVGMHTGVGMDDHSLGRIERGCRQQDTDEPLL